MFLVEDLEVIIINPLQSQPYYKVVMTKQIYYRFYATVEHFLVAVMSSICGRLQHTKQKTVLINCVLR